MFNLFSTIAKKVAAYQQDHPDKKIIRLGIGDVTLPLVPAVIQAIHKAADEMGQAETFHGYAPDLGYSFLRETIAENDYKKLAVTLRQTRSLYLTGQRATAEISRKSSVRTAGLQSATLFIPYM